MECSRLGKPSRLFPFRSGIPAGLVFLILEKDSEEKKEKLPFYFPIPNKSYILRLNSRVRAVYPLRDYLSPPLFRRGESQGEYPYTVEE